MCRERALLVVLIMVIAVQQISYAEVLKEKVCPPSSCGKISNITYPFRLKDDPQSCGDKRYELGCENDAAVLYLYSGKYYVQAINYNNYTVRVVDPGLQLHNCSSLPRYFLSCSNFSNTYNFSETYRHHLEPYQAGLNSTLAFQHIVYLNCSHGVKNKNGKYVETGSCLNKGDYDHYIYAIAGDLKAEELEAGCHVKLVATTSWPGFHTNKYHSYAAMHIDLLYGFHISWNYLACKNFCGHGFRGDCYFDSSTLKLQCWSYGSKIQEILDIIEVICWNVFMAWAWKLFFGLPSLIVLLICKWKKRHMSMYESIEHYLDQNNFLPIRYSFKEIKKMAAGFKEKLGEGGYGCVYKGKLCSGPFVAIKMLGKSKGNGQDFISEVASIGRIHHQNIVQLIGFCVSGSKRALVYELMPNGSLDKFLFSKGGSIHLSYDTMYNISIGVARGIAYLHHGCEMQILHFDIKPHNILLDENFTPKVSDFGLAKLYPIDNSIVTMTAARGTIGYMAPELFYKNIGGVSHKADVYSFGMLLMEMASKRKNLNPYVECSSQLYFPLWVYDYIKEEKDIEIEYDTEDEKKIAMKMIIVALWCIQLKPHDRLSMNRVVEMLEGNIESLEIPPKPTLYPEETIIANQINSLNNTTSSEFISSSNYST